MAVTEKQIEKLDGKRVRIKIYEFKHSIHYKILTGVVRIEYDTVCKTLTTLPSKQAINSSPHCF